MNDLLKYCLHYFKGFEVTAVNYPDHKGKPLPADHFYGLNKNFYNQLLSLT